MYLRMFVINSLTLVPHHMHLSVSVNISPLQLTSGVVHTKSFCSFIHLVNDSVSLPYMCSAICTRVSLALATAIHLIIVSAVCTSPGSKNTCDPPILAAYSDTTTSSSRNFSCFRRQNKVEVIIFVILAVLIVLSNSFHK